MVSVKPDANQIKKFLDRLAKEDWVRRSERRWWPKFVFHYTDIRNAVSILEDEHLYSRQHLKQTGKPLISSGSSSVLAGTDTPIKDFVRLYLRPKTPTQYYAEGIYSKDALSSSKFPDAHCPVLVFFLFDSAEVLARSDCLFSDKGLGSHDYQLFSTAAELECLPWKKIYQPGWVDPPRANAEVITPHCLDLRSLRYIYCRSEAERETLFHLLAPDLRRKYQDKIVATTRSFLFYRRQTFIETVYLTSKNAQVQFSPETESPGPFRLRVEVDTVSKHFYREVADFRLHSDFTRTIRIPSISTDSYTIRIFLDDHLAYANVYEDIAIPF